MKLYGESYDRFFELPEGIIGVMADIYANDESVLLENLLIYPVDHDELSIGVSNVLRIRRLIEADLRELGFTRFRITAGRLTGANPGHQVNVGRSLR